jgi:tight adherence protein B
VSPGLLLILTFVAGVLLVLGLASVVSDLVLKDRSTVNRRLSEEFRAQRRDEIRNSPLFRDLTGLSEGPVELEGSQSLRQRLTAMVAQSGLNLTLERLLAIAAGVALGAGVLAVLIRQSVIFGVIVGLAAGAVPFLYVQLKRKARLAKLLGQLPDAFDLMGRMLRAGLTTEQSVQAVADEFDQPIATEFGYCAEQQNLGLSPEIAFRDLARRTGLLEIKVFVLAMLVQQQTGGNMAELLDKLSAIVRERFRMAGKIKALTAEGRMQGLVLLILPFAIMGIMMVMSKKYALTVIQNPVLIVVMLVIEAIGALWVRKVVNFDY